MKSSKTPSAQRADVHNLPHGLAVGLRAGHATVILDVRSRGSFGEHVLGLAHAVPVFMDETPVLLPDLDRAQVMLVYCDSEQQVSSNQVAEWLIALGYLHVWVMEGGLAAWKQARSHCAVVSSAAREDIGKWIAAPAAS